ncbi:MAG: hypothetical protein MRZ79_00845 [Bacteroidia bacterium]|nr:hypothetical protein [Bacteroidia bacterium]
MKYSRPYLHIHKDTANSVFEVSILLPLEDDYDNVSFNSDILESGVEITITLGDSVGQNEHVERFSSNNFTFAEMTSLKVVVEDSTGNSLGEFFTDDPQNEADPEPTDEVSHYIYINQPPDQDVQLHVLIDIDEKYRNKDTVNLSLVDNSGGVYTIEIEKEDDQRNGMPLEGSISFPGNDPTIVINAEDVSNLRKRGPKKFKISNRDVRP